MVKSIDELILKPFSQQTTKEKIRTVLEGKPKPPLPNVLVNGIAFDVSFYDTEHWITACERRKKFFCWSCLFAAVNESEWTKEGYGNYKLLHEGIEKHKCTVNHIAGLQQLQNFVREKIMVGMKSFNSQMSETKKNYLRKRLLDFMLELLSNSSYALPKENKFDEYILSKCTRDALLLKKYEDHEYQKIIQNFSQPEMVSSYINILSLMMKSAIKKEMRNSTYVSLIINEHVCNRNGTLLSFVFRYIRNEEICERFVKFAFISTPLEIESIISDILVNFDIKREKFIAFSFDSATTPVLDFRLFVSGMKQAFRVLFFPCYFHPFETVIQRSISKFDDKSRNFFKTVNGIRDFVKRNPRIQTAFNNFVKEQFDLPSSQCTFKFITLLKNQKELFSDFLKSIKRNARKYLDDDVIIAIGLEQLLADPETIIMMEIFFTLSPIIVKINNILCSSTPERVLKKHRTLRKTLIDIKINGYQNIWNTTHAILKEICPNIFINPEHEKNWCSEFNYRFNEIMDCLLGALKIRIEPLVKYSDYLSICSSKYENLLPGHRENFNCFPEKDALNPVELQNEMHELQKEYPALTGKRDYEIYKFLVKEKLQDKSATLFKALQAIFTTPYKPASLDNSMSQQLPKIVSKLDAINFWSEMYHAEETVTNDWSFICIERDFLNSLITSELFCTEFHASFEKHNYLFQVL